MQRPTLQNVRIRSTRDALQVFHGVATNRLPLITRRLDAEERRAISPGNVYVWEERGANTEPTGLGMERWTDGMGWGPSRVRDEFLFYHQKESDATDDLVNPVTPWAQMMRRSAARPPNRPFSSMDPRQLPEAERLIKQTYSVHVSLPADRARGIFRKWHLTAYFSQQKLDELNTIDNIRGIGDVPVPDGWFKSARAGKTRRDSRNHASNPQPSEGGSPYPSTSHSHTFAHQSSPSSHPRNQSSPHHMSTSPTPSDYSSTASSSSSGGLSIPSISPGKLVPLEYLQNTSGPRRDPTDEQLLRRFSS
ncbi:Gti1/Pac2 family-domain-containing protein [Crucibulum laeve]|uniref:Gti1/Pac2 family-domain-containing protein n=1 Tax=Crucibulum laeve TaxID=68775 RepID=A0A5C3M9R3_9AGAR|nr:Gti1/Pac2 family-domain-containing protein [Crucibulum laeve]